ncbi:MAG: GHKL domain-containing protein [Defluviitaleaceae bacterium]|nr:GHKL domain-containing protein [Defluviitaleaceae bacterium]MCL2263896.1 GHKL domain-containing protein [Defluviitaleaceae bacterium]
MAFVVIIGAVSFCVFIAMYLNSMLASIVKHREWALFVFIGVFGIVSRSIPQLNSIVAVGLVGITTAILLTVLCKSTLKSIMPTTLLIALLFGIEGVTLFSSRLLGYEPNSIIIISLHTTIICFVFLLAFIFQKFFSKHIWATILNHKIIRFLLMCAGIALVLVLKNFVIDNAYITIGQWIIDFSDIALMLFLASGAAMFIIIIRFVSIESALRAEMLLAEASKKYVHDLEESYRALRTIKHDYVNILTSFRLYIDNEDMKGLTKYYYDELSEINKDLLRQDQLLSNLQNVQINEVKSILIYKCSIAVQHEICTDIEVKERIEHLGVSTAIICQILGILLDNAIEAALSVDEKKVHIAAIKNPTSKVFIIKNTWENQKIPINKMFELGFSTKNEGRGMGLYTARRYTEKAKGLYLETETTGDYFIQTLTVKDG